MFRVAFLLLLCVLPVRLLAGVAVESVRTWPAPDHTRVVFDLKGPVAHTVFVLDKPDRVVIDLRDARLQNKLWRPSPSDKLLNGIRSATRNGRDLRVVLDLKRPVKPRSFLLKPSKTYGHRLVVDLHLRDKPAKAAASEQAGQPEARVSEASVQKSHPPESGLHGTRDVVVAIDAGHGGEDPGAIGTRGTREKTVVLAVSRELEAMLRKARGLKPVMVRDGDYYVGLRRRMEIARSHGADLFISIHADSFRDIRVRGSSVYVLSRNGASSEAARWLAEQENASDLAGGVSLDDKDELLASVLLDLSQTATMSASTELASRILRRLSSVGKVHKRHVERAGFMVLKSPDVPSILVETAFISNPKEERKLRDPAHRRKLARAIFEGIKSYFYNNPPPGTLLAATRHIIARGDTLSDIAARYGVSLASLRRVNKLSNNQIRVGEVLRIPHSSGS